MSSKKRLVLKLFCRIQSQRSDKGTESGVSFVHGLYRRRNACCRSATQPLQHRTYAQGGAKGGNFHVSDSQTRTLPAHISTYQKTKAPNWWHIVAVIFVIRIRCTVCASVPRGVVPVRLGSAGLVWPSQTVASAVRLLNRHNWLP